MRVDQILLQMSLLVVLLMFDIEGNSRLAEGKALHKFAHHENKGFPIFVTSPLDKTIREGKGLSLTCEATGKPKLRIKWKKDGRSISTDDKRVMIRHKTRLRIKNAGPQDSGIYHCFAKNRLGQANSGKATVTVISDGTCRPYNGSICSRYISKDTKVFVKQLRPQHESEKKIVHAASVLADYMSPQCKDSLLQALCYDLFAPCQGGKHKRSPRRLCKDDCEVIQGRACSKEIKLLNERLGENADEIIPNCSLLPFQSTAEAKNCLPIRNKQQSCETSKDPFQVDIKPWKKTFSLCNQRLNRNVKIYNKEVFSLLKDVKAELHNGEMALDSQSMELSTYCFTASLPLRKLVRDWTAYFRTPLLPNLPRPYNLTVPGLKIVTVNSSVDTIWVPLGHAAIYTVHRKITLRNVTFFYLHQYGHGSFIAKGKYNICDTVFDMTVQSLPDGNIKLSGNSETPVDASTIETAFVSASPSSMLVRAIEKINLFVLRLMRPSMEAYINKDLIVKFSGESYLYLDTSAQAVPITLEIFGGKWGREDVLMAGITSSRITMNQALHLFTGLSLSYLDLHAYNESRVGIVLSTHALDLSKSPFEIFIGEPLAHAFTDIVPEGLSLVTRGSIPMETHKDNKMCQLFQTIFGRGSEFTLKASTNWASVILDWHFHSLAEGAVSSFDRVEMKMKINDAGLLTVKPLHQMNMPLNGILYKRGQRLDSWEFSGQLIYRGLKANLEANFETRSVWRRAFGIEYLTMKNLQLVLSLPTGQSQKSSATGQAELELGSLCNAARNRENESMKQTCVTGHLSLGLSDKSAEQFFYGSLSPVSLQKLLEVCNINHKLPDALATIGFPAGLQISVAKGAHDPSVLGGPTIKPGFILSGKMSLFGIETTGAISLLPEEFVIDAKIKSDEDSATTDNNTPLSSWTSGSYPNPKLFLKARMDSAPFVKANVNGLPRLFGIFKDVQMLATRDSLQIHLVSDVNKSYRIDVHLITDYSANRNDTQFNAMVVFDNGLSKLTRMASDYLVSMLESEMSRLKSSKGEVQRLRRECNRTIKRECSKCINLGVCASSFSDTKNSTQKKRDSQRNGSPLDLCQQVVMKRCLIEPRYHNVCRFVSEKLNKTCTTYRGAAKSQKDLERGLRWVKQADRRMYSELLQLHSISFKTNVTSANLEQTYLETTLELTIFGQKQRLEGRRMEFSEFMKFSSDIAKYAVDWYQKTKPQSKTKLRHPNNRPRSSAS